MLLITTAAAAAALHAPALGMGSGGCDARVHGPARVQPRAAIHPRMLDTAPWNLLDTWFDTRWLDTACHAFNTGAWDLVPPAYAEEGYDIIPEGFDRFPNGAIDPAVQQLALLVTIFSLLPTPGMLPKRWFGDGDEGDVSRTEGSRTEGSRTEGGVSRRKADPSRRRAKGGRGGRPKMRAPHEDEGECSSSPSLQARLSHVVSQALTHVSHTRLSHTSLTHVSHKPLTQASHTQSFSPPQGFPAFIHTPIRWPIYF